MDTSFRNKIILIKVLHGETLKNAGIQWGITGARVRAIVFQEIGKLKLIKTPTLKELRKNKDHYLAEALRFYDKELEEKQLLPCPFCGAKPIFSASGLNVICTKCGVIKDAKTIDDWNKRI